MVVPDINTNNKIKHAEEADPLMRITARVNDAA